jgi:hypothetical protein
MENLILVAWATVIYTLIGVRSGFMAYREDVGYLMAFFCGAIWPLWMVVLGGIVALAGPEKLHSKKY